MINHSYKVGDVVVCLPGFHNDLTNIAERSFAGSGYEENLIFIITGTYDITDKKSITFLARGREETILYGGIDGNGVYADFVRPANRNEMPRAISMKFGL